MKTPVTAVVAAALLSWPVISSALITQPNGSIYPQDSANGEVQLYTLFEQRGEPIDYQQDGTTTPSTFLPLCEFTAELVLNETASVLGVGWYNVDPNATTAPTTDDIHVIVPAGSPVGTVISSADILNDPAYAGGQIGFALVGWQTHYSEPQWNPECTACNPPGHWIMSVIYTSVVTPNAFYLTFEDGPVGANPADFNNDGDYNDYVYFFQGLTCLGGGEPCDTGLYGVCADGLTQCTPEGVSCQPLVSSSEETCNAYDDDCDGITDEGDICPPGLVCDHGTCVDDCGSGEYPCPLDKVCDTETGFCVEPACVGQSCPEGEVCIGGTCHEPCEGVVCPHGQVCRVGLCMDECENVLCGEGFVCDGGICRQECDCAPCSEDLACQSSTGLCVEPACVDETCADATHCESGSCVDDCQGAVCPQGQVCADGQCVDDTSAGGTGGTGAGPTWGGGGSTAQGGMGADAGSSSGGGAIALPPAAAEEDSGCGCRIGGGHARAALWLAAFAPLVLALRRRRRSA